MTNSPSLPRTEGSQKMQDSNSAKMSGDGGEEKLRSLSGPASV